MTPEPEDPYSMLMGENQTLQSKMQQQETMHNQQAMDMQNADKSMIKEQLELGEELERIENLLRCKTLTTNPDGSLEWKEPKDTSDIVLTEAGVNLILNTIGWYLNKNTLLSNYDEETILSKMEDFGLSLNDAIFMNYEKYFRYPTAEECHGILMERLKKKQQERIYTLELKGFKADPKEIWTKLVSETNPDLERAKIKETQKKNKLKSFDLILRTVQDAVHSTYMRAWRGQERTTLRQHINISEVRNQTPPQENNNSLNPGGWFKKS